MIKRLPLLLLAILLAAFMLVSCDEKTGEGNGEGSAENGGTENGGTESGGAEDGNTTVKHTVSWMDENGVMISSESVIHGQTPGHVYDKADTAEWDYTFVGWSLTVGGEALNELPAVSADVTYYAKVSQVKRTYTVKLETNGADAIADITVEYGDVIEAPEAPKKSGFRFVGWYSDESLKTAVDWTSPITGNTKYYAAWNECVDIVGLLKALLSGYNANPYSYLPETMLPGYSANVIGNAAAEKDYSGFVNVSDIPKAGYGEQWNMVIENINQSMAFFNVLSAVESISTSSVAVFNNYIDKNPGDTAHHSFASGIYNVTVDFDGETIYYVLDYTATVPVFGEQSIQISLSMDVESEAKTVRIQIGDANVLKYTVSEGSYEFALRMLGVRRSYFSISESVENGVSGHIYEYLTVSGVEIASAADFYVTDGYVSAVGNKADGMIGFTGYICELYDKSNGRMIGYEVEETLSKITYNTLWFNLYQINGISSVKYKEKTETEKAAFYINGLSKAWEAKKVGGASFKTASRRFDIEFRTQYFYEYDEVNQEYRTVKASVPMLFVQEENFDTLSADVLEKNGVSVLVNVAANDLKKLKGDYATLVDVFILGKDTYTVDFILGFIGSKVLF